MTEEDGDIPDQKTYISFEEAFQSACQEYRKLRLWDWDDRNLTLDAFFGCFHEMVRHSMDNPEQLRLCMDKIIDLNRECDKILEDNNYGGFG